jgi:peptide/nickel transport system permease protein
LLGVTLVVFLAVRFLPGDVIDQIIADSGAQGDEELRAALEEEYKLTGSLPQQYLEWLGGVITGDFGESIQSRRAVMDDLRSRLPVSLELGIIAMLFSVTLALPVGVISAVKQDTWVDYLARSFAILLLALPSFWVALMAITYGYAWFGWTPPLEYRQFWDDPITNLQILWVPALILGAQLSGAVMRLTRSTVLEVMRQDYVRTARAKGLRERSVILRHAMRNAVIPVITVIGLQVGVLVGGTVVLETIFSLPGMGRYLLTSIEKRDYPVVQAVVLAAAVVVLLSNLIVDLSYALIDPRIRYS